MHDDIEIIDAAEPDEFDKRLVALFAEMDTKQLEFIDAAGKSIVERVAALIAVLFVVTAFGEKFPPAYLTGNTIAKALIIESLVCYAFAMGTGMRVSQPQTYIYNRGELASMRDTLQAILKDKKRWLFWSGLFFALGSLCLALLIVSIIINV